VKGEFNRRRLYTGLRLDYTLKLWSTTSTSSAISVVAELLVIFEIVTVALPPPMANDTEKRDTLAVSFSIN